MAALVSTAGGLAASLLQAERQKCGAGVCPIAVASCAAISRTKTSLQGPPLPTGDATQTALMAGPCQDHLVERHIPRFSPPWSGYVPEGTHERGTGKEGVPTPAPLAPPPCRAQCKYSCGDRRKGQLTEAPAPDWP
jgi:hypothetical protein